jgi:hypothetical protein
VPGADLGQRKESVQGGPPFRDRPFDQRDDQGVDDLADRLAGLQRPTEVGAGAERMGVTKSRISQIERGEVSTIDAVARYVQSIGGRIQISAVFGDDHYILRGTITEPV